MFWNSFTETSRVQSMVGIWEVLRCLYHYIQWTAIARSHDLWSQHQPYFRHPLFSLQVRSWYILLLLYIHVLVETFWNLVPQCAGCFVQSSYISTLYKNVMLALQNTYTSTLIIDLFIEYWIFVSEHRLTLSVRWPHVQNSSYNSG